MNAVPRLFSLAHLTLPLTDPAQFIRTAARAGYDGVGLRLLPVTPEEAPYRLLGSWSALREVEMALAETGIVVFDVELVRLTADIRLSRCAPLFERAEALGARYVTVVGEDPDLVRLTERFAALCALARPFGLTLNLEPMPWLSVRTLEQAVSVVETAGRPNAGVLVDALHFHRAGSPLACLESIAPERLRVFQICDGPAIYDPSPEAVRRLARTARLRPGEGALDLGALVSRVPPSAVVSVEVPNHEHQRQLSGFECARRALVAARRACEAVDLAGTAALAAEN